MRAELHSEVPQVSHQLMEGISEMRILILIIAISLFPSSSDARVVCSSRDNGKAAWYFVIDPLHLLMVLPGSGSINTVEYNNCFPQLPSSPLKTIYSCSREGDGFTDFVNYNVKDLTWINLSASSGGVEMLPSKLFRYYVSKRLIMES